MNMAELWHAPVQPSSSHHLFCHPSITHCCVLSSRSRRSWIEEQGYSRLLSTWTHSVLHQDYISILWSGWNLFLPWTCVQRTKIKAEWEVWWGGWETEHLGAESDMPACLPRNLLFALYSNLTSVEHGSPLPGPARAKFSGNTSTDHLRDMLILAEPYPCHPVYNICPRI